MKNRKDIEILTIDKACLKEYAAISLGLENCENFTIDTKYIVDIRCVATRKIGDNRYSGCYHSDSGYIKISQCAKNILSDFAYCGSKKDMPYDYNEDDFKLMNRLQHCMDVCVFSLESKDNKSKTIYIPYDPVEDVIHRVEIDYSNCPSFEVDARGDMEIRFGSLSRLPIVERNNYIDLIEGWECLFGKYRPKKLKLSIDLFETEYTQSEVGDIELEADIINKKQKQTTVRLRFKNCEQVKIESWGRKSVNELFMTRLLDGRLYAGIGDALSIVCRSCCIEDALFD